MAESKRYVPDPVPLWPTVKWMGSILVIVLLTILFVKLLYPNTIRLWSPYTGGNTAPFSARQAPPNGRPRLQVDEHADLVTYRTQQKQLLESYAWIDKGTGVVRIPIEQAMKRVLEKGLPSRKGAK